MKLIASVVTSSAGHAEIPLVLPVLVIDQDYHLPLPEILHDLFDLCQRHRLPP